MPPNGSVASVGSVAVFARINPCTLEEIAVNEILVRKDEHEAHGSKIYVANCAAATKGLPVKFLGSFHLLLKNAAGENLQKAKNIQDQFVGNLEVMAQIVVLIKQYDMVTPLDLSRKLH
jgi:hypothetical protein